jgi:hypothetical protein
LLPKAPETLHAKFNHWLIAPPPKPPDIIPLTVLQLFDEMSKCQLFVWNAIVSRCTDNRPEFVDFYLSNGINMMCIMPCNYFLFNTLSLCYLKFWYFGRHTHFVDEETLQFLLELKVVKDLWSLHNSYGSYLMFFEDLKEIHVKHNSIHCRDFLSYTKVFLKCHMLDDGGTCFELSCVCMITSVRHVKSHNQLD